MAQKKVNIYSSTQIETLKRELIGVVDYLQSINPVTVTDVIDWKPTKTGSVMPTIISTEEKIISTVVGVIKQSAGIIIAIFEAEGMTDTLQYQIDVTTEKLQQLQEFYFSKSLNNIEDRKLEVPMSGGRIMKIVAASKEDQIQARGRITENVLKIVPMIDTIKAYKTITARGGVEISEAMQRFLTRIMKDK